nr:hypothetical protein Q903MT_gene3073 [Picea sitchensis]
MGLRATPLLDLKLLPSGGLYMSIFWYRPPNDDLARVEGAGGYNMDLICYQIIKKP